MAGRRHLRKEHGFSSVVFLDVARQSISEFRFDIGSRLRQFGRIGETNVRREEFEFSSEHGTILVFDRWQNAQDPRGDIRADLAVIERFSRSGKVDAVGVSTGGIGHDADKGAWIIGTELLSKFFGDHPEVIGG